MVNIHFRMLLKDNTKSQNRHCERLTGARQSRHWIASSLKAPRNDDKNIHKYINCLPKLFIITILFFPFTAKSQSASVTPVHGWLLGPSTLTSTGKESCILFNQFSDGSGLRFNIRDEKVETITVIYRNNIFDPNLSNSYKTILQTSGDYRLVLNGYAYSSNTLTITPPDAEEFYGELKRNSRLTIAVPKDQRVFNLRNLADNLKNTKKCAAEQAPPQVKLDPTKEIHIYADLTLPNRSSLTADTVWRAERGERLSTVLKRWSEQGGRDLNLQIEHDPILTKEFIYEGQQEDALEKLFELIR